MSRPTLVPVLAARLPLLEELAPMAGGPPSAEDMALFDAFGAPVDGYEAPDVEIEDRVVPGPHGDVPVRIYRTSGVPVEVERVAGVAHGHLNVAGLAESTATIDTIASFLLRRPKANRAAS